jgi:hypothetical protein
MGQVGTAHPVSTSGSGRCLFDLCQIGTAPIAAAILDAGRDASDFGVQICRCHGLLF